MMTYHLEIAARVGIKPHEMMRMVPSQFARYAKTVLEERARLEENEWRRNSRLIAATINASLKARKRVKDSDFMPKKRSNKQQTPTEMLKAIKIINMALGGKEVKRE